MFTCALILAISAFIIDHRMVEERVSGLSHWRCICCAGGLRLARSCSAVWGSVHGKFLLPVKLLTDLNTEFGRRRFIGSRGDSWGSSPHTTSCCLCMVHRVRASSSSMSCSCQLTGQFISCVAQARICCSFSSSDCSWWIIYAGDGRNLVLNGHCQPRRPLRIPGTLRLLLVLNWPYEWGATCWHFWKRAIIWSFPMVEALVLLLELDLGFAGSVVWQWHTLQVLHYKLRHVFLLRGVGLVITISHLGFLNRSITTDFCTDLSDCWSLFLEKIDYKWPVRCVIFRGF